MNAKIAHDNSMMALAIGTLAPLHRSLLQQLISHLVTFSLENKFWSKLLQRFSLQSSDLPHALLYIGGLPSNVALNLAQRFSTEEQVTVALELHSSQLFLNRHE